MQKYFNFSQYSTATKLWLWGLLLLILPSTIIIININQLAILGVETTKISNTEVTSIKAIHNLEIIIYKQSALREKIHSFPSDRDQYDDLTLHFREILNNLHTLMNNFAKLEMPSEKKRWKRLQKKRQTEIQTGLDNIAAGYHQINLLVQQALDDNTQLTPDLNNKRLSKILVLQKDIQVELDKLANAAYTGVKSSENKMLNIEYGTRQMSYFLLFWFYLIGLSIGYFVIRSIK